MSHDKCTFKLVTGKRVGKACGKGGKSYNGVIICQRHRNKNTKDSESIIKNNSIFGSLKPTEVIESDKLKVKKSIFNITINSNKALDTMSVEDQQKFKDVIEYLFGPEENIIKYINDSTNPDNSS